MKSLVYETIKKLYPPATINNSRAIIMQKVEKFRKYPSESLAQEIENLTGLDADFSDYDHGNGQRGQNYE